jgi:hypothetical protein
LALRAIGRRIHETGVRQAARIFPRNENVEETLRQLMVKVAPRLTVGGQSSEFRKEACDRLVSLAQAAASGDIRCVDAFNVFFERVNGLVHWRRDLAWRRVLSVYAAALQEYVEGLRAGRFTSPPGSPAEPPTAATPGALAPESSGRLRVLILADGVSSALKMARALDQPQINLQALVCNNSETSAWRFVARQIRDVVHAGSARRAAALLARRRLHVRVRGLRTSGVLRWLGRKRFDVGIHDMGVIYPAEVLAQFRMGILNAHIGLLPEYRGRSVVEWSILAGHPTGITVFFMDQGIDTGSDIVLRRVVDVQGADDVHEAKRRLFACCPEMYRDALTILLRGARSGMLNTGGRRYYVMSDMLTGVVNAVLQAKAGAAHMESPMWNTSA